MLLLTHGNNTYIDTSGSFAIGTKPFGVEAIIETGPSYFEGGRGGMTYDGDATWVPGRPAVQSLHATDLNAVLTLAEGHTYQAGDWIELRGSDDISFNGRFEIKSVSATGDIIFDLHFPSQTGSPGGSPDATFAWPPSVDVKIGAVTTRNLYSPDGQVNAIKLEDGGGNTTIQAIDARHHDTATQKSTALFVGPGSANLGFDRITIGTVYAEDMSDAVRVGLGTHDIGLLKIDRLEATEVGALLRVEVSKAGHVGHHGTIKKVVISELIGGDLDSPHNNRGSLIDVGSRYGADLLIEQLFIGRMSVGTHLQELFKLSDGAIGEIIGGDYADTIEGSNGAESLRGGRAADMLDGRDGNDTLSGGHGSDTVMGGGGDDLIFGKNGTDILYGGTGQDTILGGKGDDRIEGGQGDDLLTGDRGSDVFVFKLGDGSDTITDIALARDQIDISDWGLNADSATMVTQHAFETAAGDLYFAATQESADRIILMGKDLSDAADVQFLF